MNELITNEWYEALVTDCKAIITEVEFTSRWALVEGYWKLGERIETDENFKKAAKGNLTSLQGLAKNLDVSDRTIYYARQAYNKYPELGELPEGKNLSWNKLITKYLPEPKKEKTPELPKGKYQVIYADPPWDIGSMVLDKWESPLEDKYPTMTREELLKLPIQDLSADDCVCFMWATIINFAASFGTFKCVGFPISYNNNFE